MRRKMVMNYVLNLIYQIIHKRNFIKFIILFICLFLVVLFMQIGIRLYDITYIDLLDLKNIDTKMSKPSSDLLRGPTENRYVLLWTPVSYAPFYYFKDGQSGFVERQCPFVNCYVTANRDLFGGDLTKFDMIAFNGKNIYEYNFGDFKIPERRSNHQKYVFVAMESADNYPICNGIFDNFFNWTATYRLDSDIPIPYIQIKNQQDEVVGPTLDMKWLENDINEEFVFAQNKSKAVAWFVSNCNSRSNRMVIALELQRELKQYGWTLDIYGACGTFSCPRFNYKSNCGKMLERDYFFYLSFENSFAEDYVTEKLLTALQNNVVPIVLGGADYDRFLPPGSYLHATEATPQDLAATINILIRTPSLYNRFFRWKSSFKYSDPSENENVCAVCTALNNQTFFGASSGYKDFRSWWYPEYKNRCGR